VHHVRSIDGLGVSGRIETVRMERGMAFRCLVTIGNLGSLPVTILDVGGNGGDTTRRVVAMDTDAGDPSRRLVPFAPFTMPKGGTSTLEMEVKVRDDVCYTPNSYTGWFEEPVTFRVLGLTRHMSVPTRLEIRVAGNRETSC
jgi:hypothetical protein